MDGRAGPGRAPLRRAVACGRSHRVGYAWAIGLAVALLALSATPAAALTVPTARARAARARAVRPGKLVLPKLAAPRTVAATSGDLKNVVRWSGVGSRRVARYAVYRASSAVGPYTKVADLPATARSFTDPISAAALGVYHYKVAAVERNRRVGALSRASAAERVSITAQLDPFSSTPIVASTGELVLDVPAGAVLAPTTITIVERDAPGVLNGLDRAYTGAYDFGPDGLVFNPAARPRLGLRYQQFEKEGFEQEWVSQTSNLYVYDKTAFLWTVASQGLSVDTAENTVYSDLGHFTEYSNAFSYMPHGRSSSTTNLCNVCHALHTAADVFLSKRERVEACLYCHGADQSSGNPTATLGPNIQAEAYMCSNQTTSGKSYHPVSERKVVCASCHTPHYDPNYYPKLLYYWAPSSPGSTNIVRWYNVSPGVGGSYRTSLTPGSGQGNKVCFGCHGPFRNTVTVRSGGVDIAVIQTGTGRPENATDNYWVRTGGDHSTDMTGTAGFYASSSHGSVDNTYSPPASSYGATSAISSVSSEVQCLKCHNEHGRDAGTGQDSLERLLKPSINGTTVTGNDKTLCYACHSPETSGYPTSTYSANRPSHDVSGYPDRIAADGSRGGGGTWPGRATFENTAQVPSHIGNPHGTTNTVWPSSGLKGGECENCHKVHTTQTATYYDFLRARYSSGKGSETNAQAFAICFTCHGASGNPTGAADIIQYYGAGDGHKISTAASLTAGDGLPCYECHQPHGSKLGNRWAISDERWSNIDPGISADGTAAAQDRNSNGVNDARDFCFGCHLAFDDATATAGKVVGIDRQLVASKLKITDKPEHRTTNKTRNCKACHMSPHDPSGGISTGGSACYGCHGVLQPMEDAAGVTTGGAAGLSAYHHVLGQPGGSEGDTAPAASAYPTSTADVFCVSCHVDHNYFNDGVVVFRGANLRTNIASSTVTTASTDFVADAGKAFGICLSCHRMSRAKDTTAQKNDGYSSTTARVGGLAYTSSSHQYSVGTSFGPAASDRFDANCSKCHSDDQTKTFATSTYKFGPHVAAERRILEAFGVPIRDPLREDDCFGCHSEASDVTSGTTKPVAGRDGYGTLGASMDTTTQRTYKVFHLSQQSVHGTGQPSQGYVTCANCHNPHTSSDATKVADPYNIYNRASYDTTASKTAFCLKCHKYNDFFNPVPTYVSNDSTWVPVTVQVNGGWQWDMTTNGSRGHWSANGSIGSTETVPCASCHDKHGSKVDKLLGVYDVASGVNKINGTTITANDDGVCYACHTGPSTYFPNFSRTTSGYPNHGTWPGRATFEAGSSHAFGCQGFCHNVHGSTADYDEGGHNPTTFPACFFCHGGVFVDIKSYYPVASGGTNTGPRSGHRTLSAGTLPAGSAVPCYDCHNPHGSAETSHALMVVTQAAGTTFTVGDTSGEITMSAARTAADVRRFCFTCHTTADAGLTYGWNGTTLTAVAAPARIEGIDRTVYNPAGEHLKLPPVSGHYYNDAQSCYGCHGSSYADANSNNVHNPTGGVSNGGQACYSCHSTYQTYMEDGSGSKTGSARTTRYHHVLGGAAPYGDGDTATPSGTGSYPTSTTAVFCISCHSDHNYFNDTKGANLRSDITNPSGAATRSSDFVSADAKGGICLSCHETSLAKDNTNQQNTGTSATPKLVKADYDVSAHDYSADSSFGPSAVDRFSANCSKCHNDDSPKGMQVSANQFSVHYSTERRILAALGMPAADPMAQNHCFGCHRTAGDYYGVQSMSAAAKAVGDAFNSPTTWSRHPVTATPSGSVECVSCHNAHVSRASTPTVDPDNTYNLLAVDTGSQQITYCVKCHDGAPPAATVNAATYVPYTVSAGATANVAADYMPRGHGAQSGLAFFPSSVTTYAIGVTDVTADWTNDNNSLGAPNGTVASSPSDNAFEMRHSFTPPSGMAAMTDATITIRSMAGGGWGRAGASGLVDYGLPTGDAATGSWATAPLWSKVDDPVGSPDDGTTYIVGSGTTECRFNFSAFSLPSDATNITVRVSSRARDASSGTNSYREVLRVNGTTYNGTSADPPGTTWTDFTSTWNTNPNTGGAWTAADINGTGSNPLQGFGVDCTDATPNVWVTQVYIEVTYDVPANDDTWAIEYSTDAGTTWPGRIVAATTASETVLTDHSASLDGTLTAANAADFRVRILGETVGGADASGTVDWDASTLQIAYTYSAPSGQPVSCMDCHDKHASTVDKLVLPSIGTTTGILTSVQNKVCFGCHEDSTSGYPSTSRDASGFPTQGVWPDATVYRTPADPANHLGSLHNTAATVYPGTSYPGGRCLNCHDPHGTPDPYAMTRARYASGKGAETAASAFALCFACHDASGPASDNIQQYYTGATTPTYTPGHRIATPGGTLSVGDELPCYECHNPHGSDTGNRYLISDERWTGIDPAVNDGAGAAEDLNGNGVNDNRDFCLACHVASDDAATGGTIVGLSRQGGRLKLPSGVAEAHLARYVTRSCRGCHGFEYGTGKLNVHRPGMSPSAQATGAKPCYQCHMVYKPYMEDGSLAETGSARTLTYHHVMGSATYDGDRAFGPGAYPTSTTDVYCMSCHADHDKFNGARGGNLRSGISVETTSSSDFSTSSPYGVCASCHATDLAKDTVNQKDDGTSRTVTVTGGGYGLSAHQYVTTASVGATSPGRSLFRADCTKCHNDNQLMSTQPTDATYRYQFGLHYSSYRRILAQLGMATPTDPEEEDVCYRCHSMNNSTLPGGGPPKSVANRDWYNATSMSTTSQQIFSIMTSSALVYRHVVTSTLGVHKPNVSEESTSLADRHVECADCHNVHAAQATAHSPVGATSVGGGVLMGAPGAIPSFEATNWSLPTTSSWVTTQLAGPSAYESYVCLRCHSNYSVLPTGPVGSSQATPTDIGREFNPYNASGHNVQVGDVATSWPKSRFRIGATTYTWTTQTAANMGLTTAPWNNSNPGAHRMTCSDCHSYDAMGARGPHGSSVKYLLAYGSGATEWYTVTLANWNTSTFLCRKCHVTKSSNTAHNNRNQPGGHDQCQNCHVRIPHGWIRPRLLRRRLIDPLPYSSSSVQGLNGVQLTNYGAAGPGESNCNDNCNHSAAGTLWP